VEVFAWIWALVPSIESVVPYATTLAALAIFGVAAQVILQRKSVNADEARSARESAVFLYEVFGNDEFREQRRTLGMKAEQPVDKMSDETRAAIKAVLHRYGLVSLAQVHGGVKADMNNSYWGAALLKDWERLRPFVEAERTKNPHLHGNTERMVETIKDMKRA